MADPFHPRPNPPSLSRPATHHKQTHPPHGAGPPTRRSASYLQLMTEAGTSSDALRHAVERQSDSDDATTPGLVGRCATSRYSPPTPELPEPVRRRVLACWITSATEDSTA